MTEQNNYLNDLPYWSENLALELGIKEGLALSKEQIEILIVARNFYADYGFSPSMRPLCKMVTAKLGADKGRSLYLNKLFPGSPAKLAAKLAGLPKPKNCI
jgi:tRNA 2-thiouridine synthesizing protein E